MKINPLITVDSYVHPDGWKVGERLQAGDSFSSYRLPTGFSFGVTSVAVEIEITGRGERENGMWRCKITFVGDGEADTVVRGWFKPALNLKF